MQFSVLGPLRVTLDGTELSVPGTRERTVLAAFLLNPNQPLSAGQLIDILWPERPPRTALQQAQNCVSSLRRHLNRSGRAPEISHSAGAYTMRVDALRVDAHRFIRSVRRAEDLLATGESGVAATTLRDALTLWAGDLLPNVIRDGLRGDLVRLEEMRLKSVEDYAELEIAAGNHGTALPMLVPATVNHPYNERLHLQLMTAMHATGRTAEALKTYHDFSSRMVQELGVEPSADLRQLHQRLLRAQDGAQGEGRCGRSGSDPGYHSTQVGDPRDALATIRDLIRLVETTLGALDTSPAREPRPGGHCMPCSVARLRETLASRLGVRSAIR